MNGIKNIIFDLGGVLIDIDFKRSYDAFETLGLKGAENLFSRPDVNRLCFDFETGRLGAQELRSRFRELTGFNSTDEDFDHAWNALLGDFYAARIQRIRELNGTYRTYLLSNTNAIHCHHFNTNLKKQFGIESLDHLLHKAWYSHELELRKPDLEIFRKVLTLSGMNPFETLFLDDSETNVRAAQSVGMRSLQITPEYTIIEALKDL